MTPPQNGDTASVPAMLVELMVANGRMLETQKIIITGQEKLEARLLAENAKLEARVVLLESQNRTQAEKLTRLDESKPEKTKLTTILTAVAASVAILLGFANLGVIQQNKTQQAIQLEMLQKNQEQLIKNQATTPNP
jgi:hypothetical protein